MCWEEMGHFVLLLCQCRLALLCSSLQRSSYLLGLPRLLFELSILYSPLQVSHPPARFPPSSCVPHPRSLPLGFVPHPIPHRSHVSLSYFLVAFIALFSSTPRRVPRCYPAPSTLVFALSVFCLLRTLNCGGFVECTPLSALQWP